MSPELNTNYYHRVCLRTAQRKSSRDGDNDVSLVRSLCDEQLVISIKNTLMDGEVTLNMADVNDAYLSILKRYHIDVNETANY